MKREWRHYHRPYRGFHFGALFWIFFGLMWLPGFRHFVVNSLRTVAYVLFGV
jgi:hypothetical protein